MAECALRCVGLPRPAAEDEAEPADGGAGPFETRAFREEDEDIEVLLPLSLSCAQSSGTGGRFLILAFADGEGRGVLVAEGG